MVVAQTYFLCFIFLLAGYGGYDDRGGHGGGYDRQY